MPRSSLLGFKIRTPNNNLKVFHKQLPDKPTKTKVIKSTKKNQCFKSVFKPRTEKGMELIINENGYAIKYVTGR